MYRVLLPLTLTTVHKNPFPQPAIYEQLDTGIRGAA